MGLACAALSGGMGWRILVEGVGLFDRALPPMMLAETEDIL
jgi:hypothetical protein